MSSEVRVIFLDIDSVLNRAEFGVDMYNEYLDTHRDELIEPDVPLFRDNVENLKMLLESVPDARIVWSTDWRFVDEQLYHGWKNPRLYLESLEWFKSKLIGRTPKKMSSVRHEEIHFWFEENQHGERFHDKAWFKDPAVSNHFMFFNDDFYVIKNYVVIDDIDTTGMRFFDKHFFNTTYDKGLTAEMTKSIADYLKSNDFNYDELDWRKR